MNKEEKAFYSYKANRTPYWIVSTILIMIGIVFSILFYYLQMYLHGSVSIGIKILVFGIPLIFVIIAVIIIKSTNAYNIELHSDFLIERGIGINNKIYYSDISEITYENTHKNKHIGVSDDDFDNRKGMNSFSYVLRDSRGNKIGIFPPNSIPSPDDKKCFFEFILNKNSAIHIDENIRNILRLEMTKKDKIVLWVFLAFTLVFLLSVGQFILFVHSFFK